MADDQRRARWPDTGCNIIRLNGRHEYPQRAKPVPRKAPARPPSAEELRAVLDKLLVAQFELCGVDPHPTRASLSEMRFRQAREALAQALGLLQKLAAGTRSTPAAGCAPPVTDSNMPATDSATPATEPAAPVTESAAPANDSGLAKPRADVRAAD